MCVHAYNQSNVIFKPTALGNSSLTAPSPLALEDDHTDLASRLAEIAVRQMMEY